MGPCAKPDGPSRLRGPGPGLGPSRLPKKKYKHMFFETNTKTKSTQITKPDKFVRIGITLMQNESPHRDFRLLVFFGHGFEEKRGNATLTFVNFPEFLVFSSESQYKRLGPIFWDLPNFSPVPVLASSGFWLVPPVSVPNWFGFRFPVRFLSFFGYSLPAKLLMDRRRRRLS